jgi:hypothetical protein
MEQRPSMGIDFFLLWCGVMSPELFPSMELKIPKKKYFRLTILYWPNYQSTVRTQYRKTFS